MKFSIRILFMSIIFSAIIFFAVSKYTEYEKLKTEPLPTELHPFVVEKRDELITQSADAGISIVITDGFRTVDEQNALYARGRTEPGSIVTYAEGGESYHNYGLAIDFALRMDNDDINWDLDYDGNDNDLSDWLEVVEIAKQLGFEWGGDWQRFRDYPHLQMDFDLSIHELQRGYRPQIE